MNLLYLYSRKINIELSKIANWHIFEKNIFTRNNSRKGESMLMIVISDQNLKF